MKATIERRTLAAALKRVAPAIAKNSHLPVLYGVRIEASAGQVEFTATNLDLTIHHWCDATDITAGVVVVGATVLTRLAATLGGDTVTLALDDGQLVVTSGSGSATARLNTLNPDEWPIHPDVDGTTIELTAADVANIGRIIYAAGSDESQPMFRSVALNRGHAVACDKFRLAAVPVDIGDIETIMPIDLVRSAIAATDDTATLTFNEQRARWTAGPTTIDGPTVPADYPNWTVLLRDTSPVSATVNVAELAEAVARTQSLNADDKGAGGAVRVTFADDTATLTRSASDQGVIDESIGVDGLVGTLDLIMFNPAFLAEALRNVNPDDGTITIAMADTLKAAQWQSGDITHMLMPIHPSIAGAQR